MRGRLLWLLAAGWLLHAEGEEADLPPSVICPGEGADLYVELQPEDGPRARLKYPIPEAADDKDGAQMFLVNGPASGEVFEIGRTTITYRVEDSTGQTADCTFAIVVAFATAQPATDSPTIAPERPNEAPSNLAPFISCPPPSTVPLEYPRPLGDAKPSRVVEYPAPVASDDQPVRYDTLHP